MFEMFWYGWRIASAAVGSAVLTVCLLVLLIEACSSAGAWWQSRRLDNAYANGSVHYQALLLTQKLVSPAFATDPEEELVRAAEEAQQRAVLAECERCCAAVCARCFRGEPLEWRRHDPLERWMHRGSDGTLRDCGADALRPAPLAGGQQ